MYWYKSRIPIQAEDSHIKDPGFVTSDTVAHCGEFIAGEYAHSFSKKFEFKIYFKKTWRVSVYEKINFLYDKVFCNALEKGGGQIKILLSSD